MRAWRHIKKLAENLALLAWYAVTVMGLHGPVRFFCEDETRIGLKTISGRKITAKGIKPQGKVQWQFKATYLYGVVEPSTGESFFYEFTHLNSDCFQVFLDLVSEQYKDSILIMQLDQAGAHKAKRLKLPANIILLFQPSHAPETNPIERVWQHFKLGLRWQLPKDLDALRLLMRTRLETMTQTVIASIVGWHSILDALSVAGL
jgi:transposase